MKRLIKQLVVLTISAVLLGLAVYLHSMDHPTIIVKSYVSLDPIVFNPKLSVPTCFIPPPWYASLWPIPLAVGIAGFAYSAYSAIRSLKK